VPAVVDWEGRAYRGFACPYEEFSAEFFELVAVEHARSVCRVFLERFSDEIGAASDGLLAMLTTWLDGDATLEDVWTLGTGRLRAALRDGRGNECLSAATEFVVDLQSRGLPGTWTVRLPAPVRLHWGSYLLPSADTLAIESNGERATITSRHGLTETVSSLDRTRSGWVADDGAYAVPTVGIGSRKISVLFPTTLSDATYGDIHDRLTRETSPLHIVALLEEAISLLQKESPRYSSWVARVIRGVIPLHSPGDTHLSGSYTDRPGVVTCSFPTPPEVISELLVHEASHLYFYMLTKLGGVDDGTDTTLYYSPARQQPRPLAYILLAYHAFGNILLFQRDCLLHGTAHSAHRRERETELLDWLRQLESPLRTTRGLTVRGNALWEPLAEWLHIDPGT
jgi:HEXXH motif-containing protein